MNPDPAERIRLLSQLQRLLRERLAPRLRALFDELDVRLFDLAERSRISSQQQLYFDGLRECRRKRSDVERDYFDAVVARLRPAGDAERWPHRSPLGLVALDELEESLALSAPADALARQLAVPLDALEHRLAAIQDRAPNEGGPIQLGPLALAQTFRLALQQLDAGLEVRLVAATLFEQHVLGALEALYAELNRELVAAGVLPDLPGPGAARAADVVPPAMPLPPPVPPRTTRDPSPDLMRDLHALMARRHVARPSAGSEPRAMPREQLLRTLDRLTPREDDPQRLKLDLLALSQGLGSGEATALGPVDEGTVDMIGLVFDFVRHDPTLPAPLQALLTRLQIPFLKAALSDPELLQTERHPARQLIDDVGEAAVGWSPGTDPEQRWLEGVTRVVESLLQDRGDSRLAFERAMASMNEHQELGRRRAELAEQRAIEAALGRERLRIARHRVAAMLERRLSRHLPLPWIRQLIRGPWANYLVLSWLRQGEQGEAFRAALAFVDELLWCDEQGSSSPDESRLRDNEKQLEDELRQGLQAVAWHDREIERLAGELRQFLGSLRRRTQVPAFVFEIDHALGTADFSHTWAEHELEDQPATDAVDAHLVSQIRSLPPGTWFEFSARQGERAKLSWSSPFSGRCLFVNRNGLRVDELSPERLAAEIERGLTRVLENTRLLQRAVQSLLKRLRGTPDDGQRSA